MGHWTMPAASSTLAHRWISEWSKVSQSRVPARCAASMPSCESSHHKLLPVLPTMQCGYISFIHALTYKSSYCMQNQTYYYSITLLIQYADNCFALFQIPYKAQQESVCKRWGWVGEESFGTSEVTDFTELLLYRKHHSFTRL